MIAPTDAVAVASPDSASRSATVAAASPTAEDALDLEIDQQPAGFPDPFEWMNRNIFAFNQRLDGWVISPIARTYGYVVPDPVKTGLRNFLDNLAAPVRLVNDLLQAEWRGAGLTLARFAVNTVAGAAGLVDTASYVGIDAHASDFGQTLARSGLGSGPYLIVPVLGPTTVRDGFGALVDTALNPSIYLTGGVSPIVTASIETGASGIAEREQHDSDLRRLAEGSIDSYAALRSAYYQNRMAELRARSAHVASPPSAPADSVVILPSRAGSATVIAPAPAS